MKTELTIRIEASNLSELADLLSRLQPALEAEGVTVTGAASNGEDTAEVKVRSRSRKAKAPDVKDAAPEHETRNETEPVQETQPDAPPADSNAVADLSPEEARKRGIDEMQAYFGKNPGAMEHIKKLQTKYGVKMFQEIPDAQAHSFLADAKLLVSGAQEAS